MTQSIYRVFPECLLGASGGRRESKPLVMMSYSRIWQMPEKYERCKRAEFIWTETCEIPSEKNIQNED